MVRIDRNARRPARIGLLVIASLLSAACTQQSITATPPTCDFGEVVLDSNFASGRVDACTQQDEEHYTLTLQPENLPINHSPWYAFRATADSPREIKVTLSYEAHQHRYHPKVSTDGETWRPLEASAISILDDGKQVRLTLEVGPNPLWVSGQEIFDNQDYADWLDALEGSSEIEQSIIGSSVEGRPIRKFETPNQGQGKYVVLLGRQHPPEVTGALAMKSFVERVLASDSLAVQFREQFGIVSVPNLNPDGIHRGNWRHNANGVDLNRDWGPFTQPETRLMRDELTRFSEPGGPDVYLFLDFHSTSKDVFYTQMPDAELFPPNFTADWLNALRARAKAHFGNDEFNWEPGHNPDTPTSKAYVYDTFGIPAITFELGDETDRERIDVYAQFAAEEMMRILLAFDQTESAVREPAVGE